MSSGIYIYLKVQPYLAAYIKTAFGDPVRLERESPEARILRQFISKTPSDGIPDMGEDANIRIELPFFKEADPRVYNHLPLTAKKLLVNSFDQLFEKNMLDEIVKLENY